MKIKREYVLQLAAEIETKRRSLGLSFTEIAALSGVDASQVNRVCHGHFRTMNPSVVQICNSLGLSVRDSEPVAPQRLVRALCALWDGTPEDEERLVTLLTLLGHMKTGAPQS
ncbi:helix-turn-helix domain-containing protein [Rhizobium tumorigenes]|uniref:Helix-turn-helix transcriptional regulator n=1 Tax=Rhizobium tumorigenes TaxID=2041385 RepID=A0AAF1KSG9_9HYPH|nr:helix-turn-helix transcriptional regulator [Rhizobium tumorigenes]WFR97508.1 helix-turn-helix transcriptional regulator [Rhizobium tumorigenes]